jgi:outer membrane protein assembly factor BamB
MRMRLAAAALILIAAGLSSVSGEGPAQWPQFRGPNASGLAASDAAPTDFGPTRRLAWKQALPAGHSSPSIWGDRLFLTAFDQQAKKLEVLCLSTADGTIRWRHPVPAEQIETVHAVSNAATATPVVDGERVYAYFASYGVIALDLAGKEQWAVPLPMLKTAFGSGSSPVVDGEMVVVNRDAVEGGYLIALDRRTGKTLWKTDYPVAQGRRAESYSTPVVWRGQIVLHRMGVVDGYDLKDGRRVWWIQAITTGTSTVTTNGDVIYVATWSPFGEADQMAVLPDYATLVKDLDKDGNGQISASELPPTLKVFSRPDVPDVPGASMLLSSAFAGIDQDKNGQLNEAEWQRALGFLKLMRADHGLLAIKPDGAGDMTSRVLWKEKLAIPEVPSPLFYRDRVYYVRNGGILSCLDAATGKVIYRERLGAPGAYYSSPIAVNGKVYLASGEGTVTVVTAGDTLNVLARNDLGEPIYATPAAAAGALYVRTTGHLYAFR